MRAKENITEGSENNYYSLDDYKNFQNDILFEEKLVKALFDRRSFQYKVLRFYCDWVLQINYDYASMMQFCTRLKTIRDAIAHGEEAYVDQPDDCLFFHEHTIKLIDSLKESMIESLA